VKELQELCGNTAHCMKSLRANGCWILYPHAFQFFRTHERIYEFKTILRTTIIYLHSISVMETEFSLWAVTAENET